MAITWSTRTILPLILGAVILHAPASGRDNTKDNPPAAGQPAFCGPQDQELEVIREPEALLPPPSSGKARIHIFWRGSKFRIWKGAQCKVALNGVWVAALAKNTFTVVDVPPGKQRLCSSSHWRLQEDMKPTWRSLLFLYAAPGTTHFIECSPGGDAMGSAEPALSEVDQSKGEKLISRQQFVTFRAKGGSE